MEKEYTVLENYRIYTKSKENFIDRSFATNKFYLVLEVVLLIMAAHFATQNGEAILTIVASGFGLLIAAMWWFNQDSYDYLIKIKYKSVLEKLEEQMGVAPTTMEYIAAQEDAKKRKVFVFNNAHKALSLLVFLAFLTIFLYNLVPYLFVMFQTNV